MVAAEMKVSNGSAANAESAREDLPVELLPAVAGMLLVASELVRDEPSRERLQALREAGLFEEGTDLFSDAALDEGLRLLGQGCEAVCADESDEALRALQREWLRLFPGVGEPLVPSWANFYLDRESRVLGRETLAVRSLYRAYGLEVDAQGTQPDDDLGLMLRFLAHLVTLEAHGTDTRADQQELLRAHILPWLCTWRYAGEKHAQSDYYRGVIEFVFGLLRSYAAHLGFAYKDATRSFAMKGQQR